MKHALTGESLLKRSTLNNRLRCLIPAVMRHDKLEVIDHLAFSGQEEGGGLLG